MPFEREVSIIFAASMADHIVNHLHDHVAYGTSKAAVHHMMPCLVADWAVFGISVDFLSPGHMNGFD